MIFWCDDFEVTRLRDFNVPRLRDFEVSRFGDFKVAVVITVTERHAPCGLCAGSVRPFWKTDFNL